MHDSVVGGVYDVLHKYHKPKILLDTSDIYINAGVMLIDLKLWRQKEVEKKFINYLRLFNGNLPFIDQDTINAVCKGFIRVLHPKYNGFWTEELHSYSRLDQKGLSQHTGIQSTYSDAMLLESRKDPIIAHFFGSDRSRPWVRDSKHVFKNEYINYRKRTPWGETSLWEPHKNNRSMKIAVAIINSLPKCVYYFCTRIIGYAAHLKWSFSTRHARAMAKEALFRDFFIIRLSQ